MEVPCLTILLIPHFTLCATSDIKISMSDIICAMSDVEIFMSDVACRELYQQKSWFV